RLLALRRLEALLALARGAVHLHPFVHPLAHVVFALLWVPAREEPVELLGVRELLADDHRRVRVVLDVLLEVEIVLEDVVRDAAEERDVGSRADANPLRRHRARAREARVDVDDLSSALARL